MGVLELGYIGYEQGIASEPQHSKISLVVNLTQIERIILVQRSALPQCMQLSQFR